MRLNALGARRLRHVLTLLTIGVASPLAAQCFQPEDGNLTVDQMVRAIHDRPGNALPWIALRRAVRDPAGKQRLLAAYAAARTPRTARFVDEMAMFVRAAAGETAPIIAFYDANARSGSFDPSRMNASCWIRGQLNTDLGSADRYCDGVVASQRKPYALANRAMVELLTGRYDRALADYDEVLRTRPVNDGFCSPASRYGRGIARLRLGDAGGRADIDAALAIRPDLSVIFEDRGLVP